MAAFKVFGLKNCDTCRKAVKWLKERGVEPVLIDVRSDGMDAAVLQAAIDAYGWDVVLNRRGTTWRALPAEVKAPLDEARAMELICEHPALMKRPVIAAGDAVTTGFDETVKARLEAIVVGQ